MRRIRFISIPREWKPAPEGEITADSIETNKDEAWAALLNAPGFIKYISKWGWHFTPELAEYASNRMVNSNNTSHCWTTKEIIKKSLSSGFKISGETTWGDVTYTANMAYADFYPTICKTEDDCLKYAELVINDVDGYPGMVFHRWISDVIGQKEVINWEEFI